MHRHAERFQTTLDLLGEPGRVRETDDTAHTAADAAAALGVPVAAIVKSLVFLAGDEPASSSPRARTASTRRAPGRRSALPFGRRTPPR